MLKMDNQNNKLFFGEFNSISSHIPQILFKQVVAHKVQELKNREDKSLNQSYDNNNPSPSIRRFYGILLFVDISGFTSLSQKMPVEQFTNHINNYFTKIIDIIQKFNGEVVKFAGDALYAVWQLKNDDNIDICIANTILCAGMINSTCNNYKITFVPLASDTNYLSPRGRQKDSNRRQSLLNDSNHNGSTPNSSRSNNSNSHRDSNSNSGRSSNRTTNYNEEVMPTRRASQSLEVNLNSVPFLNVKETNSGEENLMTRGSRRDSVMVDPIEEDAPVRRNSLIFTSNNRRSSIASNAGMSTPVRRSSLLMNEMSIKLDKLDLSSMHDSLPDLNGDVQRETVEETVYLFVHSGISAGVMAGVDVSFQGRSEYFLIGQPMHDVATAEKQAGKGELVLSLNGIENLMTYLSSGVKCDITLESMSDNCHKIIFNATIPKFFGDDKSFLNNNFTLSLLQDLNSENESLVGDNSQELLSILKSHVHEAIRSNGKSVNELEMALQQALSVFDKKKKSKSKRKMSVTESIYSCEVRNVVTLFIRLDLDLSMTVLTEELQNAKPTNITTDLFDFLVRSDIEIDSDNEILHILQSCYATISKSLHKLSGQIRQFLLDDKGTVCIGSFGLKGSNTENNATAAVSAARSIVKDLREQLDIESAIGITTGRVFCGLVGSLERNEYSIMGPSVNLSARLMCASELGSVLCDNETRSNDQIHSFVAAGEIQAKGYSSKIATFSPIIIVKNSQFTSFRTSSTETSFRFSKLSRHNSQNATIRNSGMDTDKRKKKTLHGRNKEFQSIIDFVQDSVILKNNADQEKINDSKLVFISGSQGIGKSEFIATVGYEIANIKNSEISNSPLYNVYRCRCANSCSTIVFSLWRKIILDMLLGSILSENNNSNSMRTDNVALFYVSKAGKKYYVNKNHFVFQYLIKNKFGDYFSLLNDVIFEATVFESNETVNNLSGKEKIDAKANLFFAIIQSYTLFQKRPSIFIFDDLHYTDSFSWSLIIKIFQKSTDTIIISSLRADISAPSMVANSLIQKEIVSLIVSNNLKVLNIDLSPLSKNATHAIIKDIFNPFINSVDVIIEFICTYITGLCGGNARYIVEFCQLVTKAITAYLEGNHILPHDVLSEKQQNDIQSIVYDIGPKQIEDIFIQRFDQLSNDFQLILKAASAISIGGNKFSMSCLSFILPELSYVSEKTDAFDDDSPFVGNNGAFENVLLVAIEELLNLNFLTKEDQTELIASTIITNSRRLSSHTIQEVESDLQFSSSLEQNIIYDIMLQSQKRVLHERIAIFYESRIEKKSKTIEDYSILGVHWESANNWTKAMDYYYRVSCLYGMESLAQENYRYLVLSYKMLQEMKIGQHLNRTSAVDVAEFIKEDIHLNRLESKINIIIEQTVSISYGTICKMFKHDWKFLEIALRMLSQFADSILSFKLNSKLAAQIYEEGLELTLLSLKPDDNTLEENGDSIIFYIHDPSPIFFLLNSYLSLIRYNNTIEKDQIDNRESRLIDNFVSIAEKYKAHIHLLRAKTLYCEIKKKSGNYNEFIESVKVLRSIYSFEEHSISLVDVYGSDCVLAMVTSSIIYLLLLGDFDSVKEFVEFVQKNYLDNSLESKSQNLIAITLTTVFIVLQQYEDAHRCMNLSFKYSNDFVFASSIRYFKTLSLRLQEVSTNKVINIDDNERNSFTLLSILSSSDKNNTPQNNNVAAMEKKIGVGEESLKAYLCLLFADQYLDVNSPISNKVLGRQYYEAGLKYVNKSLDRSSNSDYETMSCRLINLWLKVKLVIINEKESKEQRIQVCKQILEETLEIGKVLPLADGISGYLMSNLNIDKDRGEEIIKDSIEKIVKANNLSIEKLYLYSSTYPLFAKIMQSYSLSS